MLNNSIIKIVTIFILPYLAIFAFYIQVNGEVSPGGGFQAGALFASSLIAYKLHFSKKIFSHTELVILGAIGVLIYATTGILSMISNSYYLDYSSISYITNPQKNAIAIVELGVGITVTSILLLIYDIISD